MADAFDHELVQVFRDPGTGLAGAIAVHSTALGPAMGGLRLSRYSSVEAAAADAQRLARAMTLKNSAAGLDHGGGKAVLVDDGRWEDRTVRAARLGALADLIEGLDGRYITAEDVGTTTADMDLIAARTRWVVGRSRRQGGLDDPSPATARTVFGAIDIGVRLQLGVDSLAGVHVGILGAGKVGAALLTLLVAAGARVTVADIDAERVAVAAAAAADQVEIAPVEGFLGRDFEVLSPCALGELIAVEDVPSLRCRVIAGGANNPLVDPATATALDAAGILYVPDFLANSGGIVQVAGEFEGLDEEAIATRLAACVARTGETLAAARARDVLPVELAVERATARVALAADSH